MGQLLSNGINYSGGGGSSVTWTQIQATGEKIAEITINGTTTDVLIPFEAKIIVTTTTGLTVTATKGGTTYTATETSTGVYEVTVDSKGTWTVTDGTNTTTVSVTAQTTYNVAFVVIPDGSTVTPTDDIQTWLNCANIWDKAYTTLAEVLADSTTLSALISDNNATDYLVRSTTWASGMCADSTAMSYIGLNNYCANKLLADATWRTAICNSTYFESVLNIKVPTMTGYTTPSGVASANTEYSAYYPAWKALDGVNSPDGMDCWHSKQRADHWIQYKFADTSFRVLKIAITDRYTGAWNGTVNLTFKRSSDGPAIYTTSYTQANNSQHSFVITNDNSGDTCRLELTTSSSGYVTMGILNFYGREDV